MRTCLSVKTIQIQMILILIKKLLVTLLFVLYCSQLVYSQKAYGVINDELLYFLVKGGKTVDKIKSYDLKGAVKLGSYTSVPEFHNYQFNSCWKFFEDYYIVVINPFGTSFGNSAEVFKYNVSKLDSISLRQKRHAEIDSMTLIYGTKQKALMKEALAKAKDQTDRRFIPFEVFRKKVTSTSFFGKETIKDCFYDINLIKSGSTINMVSFFKSKSGFQKWDINLDSVKLSRITYDIFPQIVNDTLLLNKEKNDNCVDKNFFSSTFTSVRIGHRFFMINYDGGYIYDITGSTINALGKVNCGKRLVILEDETQGIIWLNGVITWIDADEEIQNKFKTVSGSALEAAADLVLDASGEGEN